VCIPLVFSICCLYRVWYNIHKLPVCTCDGCLLVPVLYCAFAAPATSLLPSRCQAGRLFTQPQRLSAKKCCRYLLQKLGTDRLLWCLLHIHHLAVQGGSSPPPGVDVDAAPAPTGGVPAQQQMPPSPPPGAAAATSLAPVQAAAAAPAAAAAAELVGPLMACSCPLLPALAWWVMLSSGYPQRLGNLT
jgi:hypothetical protein